MYIPGKMDHTVYTEKVYGQFLRKDNEAVFLRKAPNYVREQGNGREPQVLVDLDMPL